MRLESLAFRLFIQRLIKDINKKTSMLGITSLLWVESTGDQWIPLTKGQ